MRSLEELKRDLKREFIDSGEDRDSLTSYIRHNISLEDFTILHGQYSEDKADLLIQEWQNQENKAGFAKSGLKTGMLVQYRDGDIRMVINNYLVGSYSFGEVDGYRDDLLMSNHGSDLDIMKISKVLDASALMPKYWTEEVLNENLLWERVEREEIEIDGVRYDKEEVKERLKELKPL